MCYFTNHHSYYISFTIDELKVQIYGSLRRFILKSKSSFLDSSEALEDMSVILINRAQISKGMSTDESFRIYFMVTGDIPFVKINFLAILTTLYLNIE